jgi:hypothetical protein
MTFKCFRCSSIDTLLRSAEELQPSGKLRLVTWVGCRDCGLWVNRLEYPRPTPAPSTTTASFAVICPTGCRLHRSSTRPAKARPGTSRRARTR